MGEPPPAGSKNLQLRFRSTSSIVIAPAKTGSARIRSRPVIKMDQGKRGTRDAYIPGIRMFFIVTRKLIEPRIRDIPERCKEKIARSTAGDEWNNPDERGGYTVHPVPAPPSIKDLVISRVTPGTANHRLTLFIRGKAMSGAPRSGGIKKFPKPPTKIGVTTKNSIINP